MKTYVDFTDTQLRKECVKIFEKVTGLKPQLKQIVLLEADFDRVYFECGNIKIDHREHKNTGGEIDFVEIIGGFDFITIQ